MTHKPRPRVPRRLPVTWSLQPWLPKEEREDTAETQNLPSWPTADMRDLSSAELPETDEEPAADCTWQYAEAAQHRLSTFWFDLDVGEIDWDATYSQAPVCKSFDEGRQCRLRCPQGFRIRLHEPHDPEKLNFTLMDGPGLPMWWRAKVPSTAQASSKEVISHWQSCFVCVCVCKTH
ncbi:unnamed protein product [Symbiodinium microadriaticum]|nr:unnamed protein product [Symbiodinium microadriaticum]